MGPATVQETVPGAADNRSAPMCGKSRAFWNCQVSGRASSPPIA